MSENEKKRQIVGSYFLTLVKEGDQYSFREKGKIVNAFGDEFLLCDLLDFNTGKTLFSKVYKPEAVYGWYLFETEEALNAVVEVNKHPQEAKEAE